MKKFMVLIILGVLLTGCQQGSVNSKNDANTVVYNGITHGYTIEEAIANGDVVQESGETMNISVLDGFLSLVDEEKDASVTITVFVTETVPCINTLEYKDKKFIYTAYQQDLITYDNYSVNMISGYAEYILSNSEGSLKILSIKNDDNL